MRGVPYSASLDSIQQAWTEFAMCGILSSQIDPIVAASWLRCAPRLNPEQPPRWVYLSSNVLPALLRRHSTLRDIARPIMEDVYQSIEGSGAIIMLSDSTNCVLEFLGDSDTLRRATRLGLRQGVFLDEGCLGANAFAVALAEGAPARIVGPEHFLKALHDLSGAAAPIFALEGRPVGVIGLFSFTKQADPMSLGIAVAAARAIENQLQTELLTQQANTYGTEINRTLNAISDGVLAWTAQGTITHINYQAGELLGLSPTLVLGRALNESIILPEGLARAVARSEELRDVEAHFTINGIQVSCLVSLQIIHSFDGKSVTYIATLRRIEAVRELVNRLVGSQARLTLEDLIGHSADIRRIRRQATIAAKAKACVLLTGETGTGKNTLARAIHSSSQRAAGPFLLLDCRAIPHNLALGEFLGFEAGAFNTGPSSGQPSKFELAEGGTLFLNEVDALSLEAQAAVLRVIETGDVIRLGGTRVIPIDVRIIASASTDLEQAVQSGAFRADLSFRLSSFVINLPPLRAHPEDILVLIDRLLPKLGAQSGQPLTLAPESQKLLIAYPWPGNIRELQSVLERAALLCDGRQIRPEHLPASLRGYRAIVPGKVITESIASLFEAESTAILNAGRASRGNLTKTAQLLGIGRTTLWRKMRQAGISAEDFLEQ
jgi:PAS domain S-box-containing protein